MTEPNTFDEWASEYMVCTEFAAAYKRANPNAVIKFGTVEGNEHAWVYDPADDVTYDATLGQFFIAGCEDDYWAGDQHPVAEETDEFHDVETFAQDVGGTCLLN